MMVLGVGVRIPVRDSFAQMLPALFLLLVNLFIAIVHLPVVGLRSP